MRKLLITALIAAGLLALISATAIGLLALPQDELMYVANVHGQSPHPSSAPLWIPA